MVTALLLSYVFVFSLFQMFNADIWLILKTGEIILKDLSVPTTNIFSFVSPDRPWIEHKWLFDAAAWLIYREAGPGFLVALKAGVLCLAVAAVLSRVRPGAGSRAICVALILLVLELVRVRLTVRAHIFSFLFMALILLVLDLYRRTGKNRLFLLLPIQVLWVNMHGSFILGPIFVLFYLLGGIHRAFVLGSPGKQARQYAIWLGLVLICCLLNPYGPRIFLSPLSHLAAGGIPAGTMAEWQGIDFIAAFSQPDWQVIVFSIIALAGLASFLLQRLARVFDVTDFLLYVSSLYLAFSSSRFIFPFALISFPIMAGNIMSFVKARRPPILSPAVKGLSMLLVPVIALLMLKDISFRDPRYPLSLGETHRGMPSAAVDFIRRSSMSGRVFNSFDYGGYLAGRLYPDVRIYIDGRIDLYSREFFNEYLEVFKKPRLIEDLHRKHPFDFILILWNDPSADRLMRHLNQNNDWPLVYYDSRFALLASREKRSDGDLFAYTVLKPSRSLETLELLKDDPLLIGRALNECDTLISQNPGDPIGFITRGYIFENVKQEQGYDCGDYGRSVELDSRNATSYLLLGTCLGNRQQFSEAGKVFEKLLSFDSDNVEALLNLGLCHYKMNAPGKAKEAWERVLEISGDEPRATYYLQLLEM